VFDELKKSLELHGSVRVWLGVAAADTADTPAAEIYNGDGNVSTNSSSNSGSSGSNGSSKRARTDTPPLDPAGPSAVSLGGAQGAQGETPSQPPPPPPPPPSGRVLTADVTAQLCSPCWRLLPSANALQVLISYLHTR